MKGTPLFHPSFMELKEGLILCEASPNTKGLCLTWDKVLKNGPSKIKAVIKA